MVCKHNIIERLSTNTDMTLSKRKTSVYSQRRMASLLMQSSFNSISLALQVNQKQEMEYKDFHISELKFQRTKFLSINTNKWSIAQGFGKPCYWVKSWVTVKECYLGQSPQEGWEGICKTSIVHLVRITYFNCFKSFFFENTLWYWFSFPKEYKKQSLSPSKYHTLMQQKAISYILLFCVASKHCFTLIIHLHKIWIAN